MKKIKILLILPKAQQGGAETQLLYLVRGLDRNKFKVYLGLLYECDELIEAFEKVNDMEIVHFRKKHKFDLSVHLRIAKFIKKNSIDIIHSIMGNNNAYLPALIAGSCAPVGGIMSSTYKGLHLIDKLDSFVISKIFSKTSDLVLVSCSYSGMELYVKKGFDERAVYTIPNGIDYDRFCKGNKNKIIKEFGLKGKFIIGTVGRLSKEKNHEQLIRMFKEISKANPSSVLLIIGGGPLMEHLKSIVSNLDLQKRVILTSNRKDVPDFLAAMNIFVLPSLTEGWPNVIGEAMAAGLPVVSYPVGDVRYVVKNNFNGIITKDDTKSFQNAIIGLMNDHKKMKRLGVNAQKTIKENFSVEKMVRKYEQFYIQLSTSRKRGN